MPDSLAPIAADDAVGSGTPRPRSSSSRRRYLPWLAVALWAAAMAPLTRWGLPNREADDLLFGGTAAWSANQYRASTAFDARQQRATGADTDLNPLAQRDRIVDLTATPADRAEILRRYRLFSRQPDEMITFMALQRMRPRQLDFDPRLYQYGGGYIYLIGAALGTSAACGATHLSSEPALYLERPEEFARFYLVARVVTLAFGALLLVAVWRLAHRAAGPVAAWLAMLLVACTPVFISGVLEAKPHLPSACLMLWATLAALDYQASGKRRDAVRLGVFAGYALGLVLTGVAAAALWPTLFITRLRVIAGDRASRRRLVHHLLLAGLIAAAVYVLTNPYIPYNYLFNRAALASNVGNSTAMYAGQVQHAAAGALRVGELLIESAGVLLPLVGLLWFVWISRGQPRHAAIMASAGLALLLICVLLGAGKPAEYARFLVLPVTLLAIPCAALLATLAKRHWLLALAATLAILVSMKTPTYLRSFVRDCSGQNESRRQAGRLLADLTAPAEPIAVLQEPAPYAVPPLDFAHRQILWLPPQPPADLAPESLPRWLVFTADDAQTYASAWWRNYYEPAPGLPTEPGAYSRITWANKAVFICERSLPPAN